MTKVALATNHGKERAFGRPMRVAFGYQMIVPGQINTDIFGTFTGEIARSGNAVETAYAKARLGMQLTGLERGLASEGSFGAHPVLPFTTLATEIIVFADNFRDFQVSEQIITTNSNFAHILTLSFENLENFLLKIGFPSHAVIVRPNITGDHQMMYKGLQSVDSVKKAVKLCCKVSEDLLARVETDMRAHMNPTRMRTLGRLAVKLARRMLSLCPRCNTPGFGLTEVERGLECRECGLPTLIVCAEIHSCFKCG